MSDNAVVRYDLFTPEGYACMQPYNYGGYVLYEDYKTTKDNLDRCTELLDQIHAIHEDKGMTHMVAAIEKVLTNLK